MATTIDREFLREFRKDLDETLSIIGQTHGVVIKLGSGSFASGYATFKLEISTVADNGQVVSKEASDFKAYARRYGLEASMLGQTFRLNGSEYEVMGCNPRATAFPILVKQIATGKVYTRQVKSGFDLKGQLSQP